MKKMLIWVAGAVMAFASCNKEKTTVTFFARDKTDVTIPATVAIDVPFLFQSPDYNLAELLALNSNNTSPDRVKSVIGDAITVSVLDTTRNLDFLKHATIYVYNDSIGETKLADKLDVPTGVTSVDLDVNKVELVQYVHSSRPLAFKLQAGMRNSINQQIDVRISYRFKVKALLFK